MQATMTDKSAVSDGLDQLVSLEERIGQTIHLLKTTRTENAALLQEKRQLEGECESQRQTIGSLDNKVRSLEQERDAIRERLQKLLEQVDSLIGEKV